MFGQKYFLQSTTHFLFQLRKVQCHLLLSCRFILPIHQDSEHLSLIHYLLQFFIPSTMDEFHGQERGRQLLNRTSLISLSSTGRTMHYHIHKNNH